MITLHIEHTVRDFEAWKAAFDRDPAGRARAGVRRYVISRPIDQPLQVNIDLEFDDRERAEAMLRVLENVWQSPQAKAAVNGGIRTVILEQMEVREL
jgi:hypothetical protein